MSVGSYTHGTYTAYARHGCRCDRCRAYQNERVAKNRRERLEAGRLSHGTASAWDAGCRCDACRQRHDQRHRAYRQSKGGNTTRWSA